MVPNLCAKQLVFGLESAVAADVVQRDAALFQDAADEEPTMAVQRILFGAHEGDTVRLRPRLQPINAFEEEGGLGQTRV